MIFSEPPRTQYDLHFSVLSIPVRVHPFFWLVAVLLGIRNEQPIELIIWVCVVFVSILVHELGHALAARACGWQPWVTLHGFGGLASYRPTYHSPRNQVLITLAGPGAGFALAASIVLVIAATGHQLELVWLDGMLPVVAFDRYESPRVNLLLHFLLFINIFWGFINLLPIYPLDGGQISQQVFQVLNPRDGVRQSLLLSIFVSVGMAILMWVRFQDTFLAIFFGYLAYNSYATLQAYFGGGWGGYR